VLVIKTFIYVCCILAVADADLAKQTNTFSADELIGKTPPKLYGTDFKLQKEAFIAFNKMQEAALRDGIKLQVVSSFRSYGHQNAIWERKYLNFTKNGKTSQEAIAEIIKFSTIPGTSRHHWATDIDIVDGTIKAPADDVLQAKYFSDSKIYGRLKTWLDKYANQFGFYLVYTDDANRKGFEYEPWHYSYAAISKPMLQAYLKLDLIKILQENKLIGSDCFTKEFIKAYKTSHVLGINKELK
jgi:LAS superfamily LD-carboxypeptidase LdcB